MERPTSPTKSPATPRSNLKSMLTASCVSTSGIQITPPSASRTNLFSVTRPFPEESTEVEEETYSGLRRTLSSPIRRARDVMSSSSSHAASDTESQTEDETNRKSHSILGLRKSPSWSALSSPSKSKSNSNSSSNSKSPINKSRHRKEPTFQDGLTTDEDEGQTEGDVGETTTTRRSHSPHKELDRANSLKDKALELIRGGKRGSFSSTARESIPNLTQDTSTLPGRDPADQTGSTTPPGTPHTSLLAGLPVDRTRRSTPSPSISSQVESAALSSRKSVTPSPKTSTMPSPRKSNTPFPMELATTPPKTSTTPSPRKTSDPPPWRLSTTPPTTMSLPRRSSSSLSAPEPILSTPKPFGAPSGLGELGLGPGGSLRRGILKLSETPGSGRSVRFGSRNAYRILTPTSPTTSFTSSDPLGGLFALGRRGRQDDDDEDDDTEGPKAGLESSVSAVGRGRPPINRMGSSSSSISTGSTSGTGKKTNPIDDSPSKRMSKRPSIEEKLRELYLVGKKTIESASSASSIDAESEEDDEPTGTQPEMGSTLDMPSEGAFEGSEYSNFLLGDKRMEGLLPEESGTSERERTIQKVPVASTSSTSFSSQKTSTSRKTVLEVSVAESERTQILLDIREKQQARIDEESTVLGLLGDRTNESRRSSEASHSRGSPASTTSISPNQRRQSVATTTTPKISPSARRVSSASRGDISMTSSKGSFDVLSHYGDDASTGNKQARMSSGSSARKLSVDSPNLSRWSPDTTTTGEEPSRSRSVSLSNLEIRNSRTEASLADESDRSIGVMIVHEDEPAIASGGVPEAFEEGTESMKEHDAFEDGTESMKDGSSMESGDKASFRSSVSTPDELATSVRGHGSGSASHCGNAIIELSLQPATPEKAINPDKTMFWTPGSVFQDLSLSDFASPTSNTPASGDSLAKSIVSLGHALIAAEDDFIDQLKSEIERWKGIAEHLHGKVETSESNKRRIEAQVYTATQSPTPSHKVESDRNANYAQMTADLVKAKDEKREAEIQLEGMQRHYSEAKEREDRWQARYELVKNSWEAEKREKEELAVRMRDEEIKRQGSGPSEKDAVPALKAEVERLKKENAQQAELLRAMADHLESQSGLPRDQEKLLRNHAASLEKHLEEQRVEANTRLAALAKDNSTLKKQRDDLHEHRLDLETALDALRAERTAVQKMQKRLTRKHADMETDLVKIDEEHQLAMKERDGEVERLRAESKAMEDKCRDLGEERDTLIYQTEGMSKEMDMIVQQAREIAQQHAELGDRMAQVQQERDALHQEKQILLAEHDAAIEARELASKSESDLLKDRDQATQRANTLEAELANQEKSNAATRASHQEALIRLESELQHRREEELQYQALVESLEEQLNQSDDILADAKAEAHAASESRRTVEQQLAQTQERHDQELSAARDRFEVLDREYVGIKEDNLTLMSELDKMHSLIAETNRSSTASSKNEAALQARIDSLEENIDGLKKSILSLKQDSSAKDTQIQRLQRAREQLKDDKEMLNIALDSKQQEVELLRRKYGDGRQSITTAVDDLGESISATPAATRLAASVRRHRSSTANLATPVPNQRSLGRGTPSTINTTRRFPSVPKSLDNQVDVSNVLNSSIKFNRKASLGLSSARRATSMTSSKNEHPYQGGRTHTTEAEYRAMSLVQEAA